jgi:hypothetical protein
MDKGNILGHYAVFYMTYVKPACSPNISYLLRLSNIYTSYLDQSYYVAELIRYSLPKTYPTKYHYIIISGKGCFDPIPRYKVVKNGVLADSLSRVQRSSPYRNFNTILKTLKKSSFSIILS